MLTDKQLSKLKSLLESEYDWPSQYLFKFIVPKNKVWHLEKLFPQHPLELRSSKTGKYVSVTVNIELESADIVIAIYQKASHIEGLISL